MQFSASKEKPRKTAFIALHFTTACGACVSTQTHVGTNLLLRFEMCAIRMTKQIKKYVYCSKALKKSRFVAAPPPVYLHVLQKPSYENFLKELKKFPPLFQAAKWE